MAFIKYIEIGKISIYNSLTYLLDFFSGSLFIGLIIFVFIQLWSVVYGSTGGLIEGYTINMMVWYLVLTEAIVTSPGKILEEIGDEIQTGNIAQNLNKPYNYVGFKYASSMARTWLRFLITFGVGSLVAYIFLGGLEVKFLTLPIVLVSVFLALTLHFLIMVLLGILVFWLEDATATYFIYQKIVFVLGGMLMPLEIFPIWLGKISAALPFSYIAYHPAKLFVNFQWSNVSEVLLKQLMWIIIMIAIVTIVYQICIRKISINGG
ncbi:ABC-2 family transporter protein [Candidatus Woesearchaeota archaeon]|nr:ABC-2 family transporter protein [Candidatus Woesearchaeota archaeon]